MLKCPGFALPDPLPLAVADKHLAELLQMKRVGMFKLKLIRLRKNDCVDDAFNEAIRSITTGSRTIEMQVLHFHSVDSVTGSVMDMMM